MNYACFRSILTALVAISLSACGGSVFGGGGVVGTGSGTEGGGGGDRTSGDVATCPTPSAGGHARYAISIRVGDLPAGTPLTGATDPDALLFVVSDQPLDCAAPLAPDAACGFRVAVTVPPAMLVPGDYELPVLDARHGCAASMASISAGQINVIQIDPDTIHGAFSNVPDEDWALDGGFAAKRCGQPGCGVCVEPGEKCATDLDCCQFLCTGGACDP